MKDDILPAVPLFIFMGYMTEQAGLMERLFLALRNLLAPLRGSLYLAVILTATIFAMATGIVGAAVTVLGIMAGPDHDQDRLRRPAVGRRDRRRRHARHPDPAQRHAGGDGPDHRRSGEPALLGRVRPGLPAGGLYIAYCLVRSFINPKLGPPVPKDERVTDPWSSSSKRVLDRRRCRCGPDRLYAGHHPRRAWPRRPKPLPAGPSARRCWRCSIGRLDVQGAQERSRRAPW